MPIAETLAALRAVFGDLPTSEFRGATRVVVPAERIYEVLEFLKEKHGFDLLVDITCVDYLNYPGAKDRFGLVYLLADTDANQRLTIRTFVNEPEPVVRSVVGLWEGATGWNARSGTCSASVLPAIPTCGGSSCRTSSRPFRSARTIPCKGWANGTISPS